jgi:hypothetical protein
MELHVNKLKLKVGILVILLIAGVMALWKSYSPAWFVEYPFPLAETHRLFDIGIVDFNGDDFLDVYTSNHHFRQSLLSGDAEGGFTDVLSEWGLDQSREFPLAELSFTPPVIDKPGLYIYWLGTRVVVKAHKTNATGDWQGKMRIHEPVEVIMNDGFVVEKNENEIGATEKGNVYETQLKFRSSKDAELVLNPGGQGLPLNFQIDNIDHLDQIYVGRGKISPKSEQFSLFMKDRHALAWADINDDGILDVFINRGALGGALRAFPTEVKNLVEDELLISQAGGTYLDMASDLGLSKKDCSGRHARWLDFNHDGVLDLFVNCYDRENVIGNFSKQLWKKGINGRFKDVAVEVGIDIPDQQIGSFAWIDTDSDGDTDLVAYQDEGIFLYRNQEGKYLQEAIYKRDSKGVGLIGQDGGDYWFFDGKISVADYDADGDLDIFSASKKGNIFLSNSKGNFISLEPQSVGLPATSITANWVDYDNDGLQDLHTIPQGIYKQTKRNSFEQTGLLSFPDEQYTAAIGNWFDIDNDGRRDVLIAFGLNRAFKRWWQILPEKRPRSTYPIKTYRNTAANNHWLQIKLVGGEDNRQAIGTRVTVKTPDGLQVQEVGATAGAFFSQGPYRLYFGLGRNKMVENMSVRWSDGVEQEFTNVSVDRLLTIDRQAEGR